MVKSLVPAIMLFLALTIGGCTPFPYYTGYNYGTGATTTQTGNMVNRAAVTHTHCGRTHSHPLPPEGLAHHHGDGCMAGSGGATTTTTQPNYNYGYNQPPATVTTYNYTAPATTPYYDYSAGNTTGSGYSAYTAPKTTSSNTYRSPASTIASSGYYTVQKGDTVFQVMRNTGVYWKDIIRLNKLQGSDHPLTPGQTLILGTSTQPPPFSASRVFSGPTQYPPTSFAAYGILAFTSKAQHSDTERARFRMFCDAYLDGLSHADTINDYSNPGAILPKSEQMVTVWPIDDDYQADFLNQNTGKDICEIAIDHYDLGQASQAIRDARATEDKDVNLNGRGPFLFAWSPATEKGRKNTIVLYRNLSGATHPEHIKDMLRQWKEDIERNPSLWSNGFSIEKLRTEIRLLADKHGTILFRIGPVINSLVKP